MKNLKKLAILFAAIVVCGCDEKENSYKKASSNPDIITNSSHGFTIYTISHDKHKWVVVTGNSQYYPSGGLTHHPDCECKKINTDKND